MPVPLFQLEHITKSFPGVVANDDVSLALWEGTIHAVIGENGAGKSTLMSVLYGRYQPDSGRILHRGKETPIRDPSAAIALGIGMVTQHTTMIPALSALDNIILGHEPASTGGIIDHRAARRKVDELEARLGIRVDWDAEAEKLSVASLQKAEIVKALYRGAQLLILDEPTATLAPPEAEALFALLRALVAQGVTVVFVTHKLREVMAHSEKITVLRGGKVTGERATLDTYPEELLALMLGKTSISPGVDLTESGDILAEFTHTPEHPNTRTPEHPHTHTPTQTTQAIPPLEVCEVSVSGDRGVIPVNGVSFTVMPGEVVGVAGVDGSGQRELARAIVGLFPVRSGRIMVNGRDATRLSVGARQSEGVAYIPEDRQREGLILDFTLAENMALGKHRHPGFGGGRTLNLTRISMNGEFAIRDHRIRAGGSDAAVRTLSGGNQQKVVIARALEARPRVLVAMQPTRGLDVEATRFIYASIRRALADGMGLLLFSLDMDEIMELSDRIAVMYNGGIVSVVPRDGSTPDDIGRMMVEGRA